MNNSITTATFPDMLKMAEVIPIHKKNDVMDKHNYRPVSVLPTISKIFEKVMTDQLNTYFEPLSSPYMLGFRKNHSCEHVLLHFIESAKLKLDKQEYTGAVLTDLSKALDCLPPKLLISKFHAFGVDDESCELLSNYFMNRMQRVKIGNVRSEWKIVGKGAAKGS